MKILLITERTDSSIGMRLAGVETALVRDSESAEKEIAKAVADSDIGLILITDGIEKLCCDTIADIKKKGKPLLVGIPDSDKGFTSSNAVSDYVKNAIGINI